MKRWFEIGNLVKKILGVKKVRWRKGSFAFTVKFISDCV